MRTGFPASSVGKESACKAGDPSSIPGWGRSPGEGKGYPLQYSGLENPMDCIVHGVAKSRTQLSDFHFTTILRKLYVNSPVLAQPSYTRIFPRALKLVIFSPSDVLKSLPDGWTSAKFFSSLGADPYQHPTGFLICSCKSLC